MSDYTNSVARSDQNHVLTLCLPGKEQHVIKAKGDANLCENYRCVTSGVSSIPVSSCTSGYTVKVNKPVRSFSERIQIILKTAVINVKPQRG